MTSFKRRARTLKKDKLKCSQADQNKQIKPVICFSWSASNSLLQDNSDSLRVNNTTAPPAGIKVTTKLKLMSGDEIPNVNPFFIVLF